MLWALAFVAVRQQAHEPAHAQPFAFARRNELIEHDLRAVERTTAETIKAAGQIDVLVNNAGVNGPSLPLWEYPPEAWARVLAVDLGGVFLPWPQIFGALVSLAAFGGLHLLMSRTDFGRALEATREDAGAVALVGIDKNRVFAVGWGLGAARVGLAGAIRAMGGDSEPDVGAGEGLLNVAVVAGHRHVFQIGRAHV